MVLKPKPSLILNIFGSYVSAYIVVIVKWDFFDLGWQWLLLMNKNIQILVAVWCYINLVTPFKHLTLWSAWTVSWSDKTRHGFHPVEQRAVGYVYNSYTTILQSTADKLVALLSITRLDKKQWCLTTFFNIIPNIWMEKFDYSTASHEWHYMLRQSNYI